MDLSIILVNWNSTAYLWECISSVFDFTHGISFEIIVIDNASPIDDVGCLHRRFPSINLIKSPQNLGFAKANNLAFRSSSGDCVLFLNPDTKLTGPAIQAMLESLVSLKDAGVVGCKLLNADMSVQTSCIQTFPTILNQVLDADYLRKLWPSSRLWGTAPLTSTNLEPAVVEVVSGACLMIKREVFEVVGMFSDDYFMYAEDLDLCYKVMRAGYRSYYVGGAAVVHYGGGSSSPRKAAVMKWRSILRYCTKTRGWLYGFAFRIAMVFAALIRLTLLTIAWPLTRAPHNLSQGCSAAAKWRAILRTLLTQASSTC